MPSLYREIASVYGRGCELALMPIGSYCPRWHLRQQHCDPADVVRMHLELGTKRTLGVHYGTWILSDEHYLAPPRELRDEATKEGLEIAVVAGELGRTVVIPFNDGNERNEELEAGIELGFVEARDGKCVVWR